MTAARNRRELENQHPSAGAWLAFVVLVATCMMPIVLLIAGAL